MTSRKELRAALSAVTKMHDALEARGEKSKSEALQSILDELAVAVQEAADEIEELLEDDDG